MVSPSARPRACAPCRSLSPGAAPGGGERSLDRDVRCTRGLSTLPTPSWTPASSLSSSCRGGGGGERSFDLDPSLLPALEYASNDTRLAPPSTISKDSLRDPGRGLVAPRVVSLTSDLPSVWTAFGGGGECDWKVSCPSGPPWACGAGFCGCRASLDGVGAMPKAAASIVAKSSIWAAASSPWPR